MAMADLAASIGVYVELTPQGSGYVGCCPFHHEATPSFVVVPARPVWYCFGCGATGKDRASGSIPLEAFRRAWWARAAEG
jgi:DNA primase